MARFHPVIAARPRGGAAFSVHSVDLDAVHEQTSPIVVLDDFRVSGRPFGPHPHAGFSTVTYVFEDSASDLRSRDSLGNDLVVKPGGIVWTQAGSGMLHEETPADFGRELHGLQVFVNLSAANKLVAPAVLRLQPDEVPEWRDAAGNRVRVPVGTFGGVDSRLVPVEPFDVLDVELRTEIGFELPAGRNAIVYVREGEVAVRADDASAVVGVQEALPVQGAGRRVRLAAVRPARATVLAGLEIREPVLSHGSFIMNDRAQIEAALERYRNGGMGALAPL